MLAIGIRSTAGRHGIPPSWERAHARLSRFVRRVLKRPQTVNLGRASSTVSGLISSARVRVSPAPWTDETSVTRKLADLRRMVEGHDGEITELHQDLDKERTEREDSDRDQRAAIDEATRALREEMKKEATVDLRLESWGAALFFLGAILNIVGIVAG